MSMPQHINRLLEKLAHDGPEAVDAVIKNDGYILGLPLSEMRVGISLTLQDYDRFSAVLHHLEVYHQDLEIEPDEAKTYLHQAGRNAARRLTYLEEPIDLLEFDRLEQAVQLRSAPPTRRQGGIHYWELLLWVEPQPHARLTRYQWSDQAPQQRTVAAYPATFGTLARLGSDLAAALVDTTSA